MADHCPNCAALRDALRSHDADYLLRKAEQLKRTDGEGWAVGEMVERAVRVFAIPRTPRRAPAANDIPCSNPPATTTEPTTPPRVDCVQCCCGEHECPEAGCDCCDGRCSCKCHHREPQQEQLSPLAQALVEPWTMLQVLEADGVISEADADQMTWALPVCRAVAELLRHQDQQSRQAERQRVLGVLVEADRHTEARYVRQQAATAERHRLQSELRVIRAMRQRLSDQPQQGGNG